MPGFPRVGSTEQGSHFWLLVMQSRIKGGVANSSYSGTLQPDPGETRYDLFLAIRDMVAEQYPDAMESAVLAFDVQPNQI